MIFEFSIQGYLILAALLQEYLILAALLQEYLILAVLLQEYLILAVLLQGYLILESLIQKWNVRKTCVPLFTDIIVYFLNCLQYFFIVNCSKNAEGETVQISSF